MQHSEIDLSVRSFHSKKLMARLNQFHKEMEWAEIIDETMQMCLKCRAAHNTRSALSSPQINLKIRCPTLRRLLASCSRSSPNSKSAWFLKKSALKAACLFQIWVGQIGEVSELPIRKEAREVWSPSTTLWTVLGTQMTI